MFILGGEKRMITIFTPTYNRAKTLERLYQSLVKQANQAFEWLVVDDGSTDDTKALIEKFSNEQKITIRYLYKTNGGKMSAYNLAIKEAHGEWMLPLDSDDYLMDNSVAIMTADLKKADDNDIAGIIYLDQFVNHEVTNNSLPDVPKLRYTDLKYKYNCMADKTALWKVAVLKQYQYPIITNETFIPDDWLTNEISKKYYVLTHNVPLVMVEYQRGGLSDGYFNLVKRNPKGTCLYYLQCYEFEPSFYNVYAYLLFADFAHYSFKKAYNDHPAKVKICLLYLPVLLISWIRR